MHPLARTPWRLRLAAALCCSLTLAGCGGAGEAVVAPAPATVAADPLASLPTSLAQSAQATIDYQRQLATQPSETHEPLDLGQLSLPQSDTTEPALLE